MAINERPKIKKSILEVNTMDKNEKVIEMEAENNSQEVTVIEVKNKKKFRDTKVGGFVYRHRKPILIVLGAAAAVGGAAAAKALKNKHDAETSQAEADQAALAEDWYNRSLLEAHESSNSEPVETEYAPTEIEV